jgi:hypothetical protein
MKPIYYLSSAGHECGPEFKTLKEARQALRELKQAEMKLCRARFGKAFCHPCNDTFMITLAKDRRSALWTSAGIVQC